MISFILGPYDDESLFSLLARIHKRLIGTSRQALAAHLFGNPRMVLPFDFPCAIDALAKNIGSRVGLTADEMIHNHTMYPLARMLMPPEQAERLKLAMRGDKPVAENLVKWQKDRSDDGLRHLKICRRCTQKDLKEYQLTWWRRTLQVPGVFCCPECDEPVEYTQFVVGQFWNFDYPDANDAVGVRRAREPDGIDITYARDVYWILKNNPESIDPDKLRRLYHSVLEKRGLVTAGQLKRTEFLQTFHKQRTASQWAERNLAFDPRNPSSWPADTVKTKANHRSFRTNLIMMRYLDAPVSEIHPKLEALPEPANQQSARSSEWLIQELKEKWPDPDWTEVAIVKHLGIGRNRLLNLAGDAGLSVPRFPGSSLAKTFEKKREKHRKIFRAGREAATAKQWRTTVRWLQRCDRKWVRVEKKVPEVRPDKVDWKAREKDYLGRLPGLIPKIHAMRPFRMVCIAAFLSLLPFGASLSLRLDKKMPKLAKRMRDLKESPDEFTLRRIKVFRQLYPEMPPHQIRERASVSRSSRNPKIMSALGYTLSGKKWASGNPKHPLYGLSVVAGPARGQALEELRNGGQTLSGQLGTSSRK